MDSEKTGYYERFKIKDYKHWAVYLHQNQYYLGRMYVWSKRENALDFSEMHQEEREELFVTILPAI